MTAFLRVALAVIVVLVSAVSAQAALSVFPPAPTSADPVTLYTLNQGCLVSSETVTRTGKHIQVALKAGDCPSPGWVYAYGVSLGTLPAGQYHVELTYIDARESLTFIVLEANPKVTVRPFVVPTHTAGFPLHFTLAKDFKLCGDGACEVVFDIGGVKYRGTDIVPHSSGIVFYAPDLAPGLHDIRITNDKGTTVIPAAIYYQDPGAAPDPAIFERVLFPVLFRSGGTGGSEWRSEAVISNPTSFAIENANDVEPPVQCVRYPCGERLEPKSRRAFSGLQYSQGVALMVPRREADNLAFSLRIRDVSREADNFGTEIPVVRESEMFRNTELTLLDVPLDPRYRTKLRIYTFPDPIFEWGWGSFDSVTVRVLSAGETTFQTLGGVPFSRHCTGVACAWTPRYTEIDLPARGQGARADVYVEFRDRALGWAFASVTNNKTQQVTIVTPNQRGGHPQ